MYLLIKYITTVNYNGLTTYYFFSKKTNYLIPFSLEEIYEYKHEYEYKNKYKYECSNGYEYELKYFKTMNMLIKGLGGKILGIKVYLYLNNRYYTYISIKKCNEIYDISCSPEIGFGISLYQNIPVYIKSNILCYCGIKVNKELIRKSLSYNRYSQITNS